MGEEEVGEGEPGEAVEEGEAEEAEEGARSLLSTFTVGRRENRVDGSGSREKRRASDTLICYTSLTVAKMSLYGGIKLSGSKLPTASTSTPAASTPAATETIPPVGSIDQDKSRRTPFPRLLDLSHKCLLTLFMHPI